MRLNDDQLRAIHELTNSVVGEDARLWLFGSRADDAQRGGDIDLYVEVDRVLADRLSLAIRLAARLERRFDGLPVDVILKDRASSDQPIHELAKRTGVRL